MPLLKGGLARLAFSVIGDAFSTGGNVAHGDLTGAGGAGGLATRVGLS